MENKEILEPLKEYNNLFKNLIRDNASNYFDELVKNNEINVEANRDEVKQFNENTKNALAWEKKENKSKNIKGLLITLVVIMFVASGILFYLSQEQTNFLKVLFIVLPIVLIICGIFVIIQIKNKINKQIEARRKKKEEYFSLAKEHQDNAFRIVNRLNEAFDWNMTSRIIEKTTPIIRIDDVFQTDKFEYLCEKYGFSDNLDPNSSTQYVRSGDIEGNPFVIVNTYNQEMRDKVYQGSITIHWTTTYRDSQGHSHTQYHTQVLTAQVVKPAPFYYYNTKLVYGCDAAPNLSFGHEPTNVNNMSEKQIKSMVKKGDKQLNKKVAKSLKTGENFTKMANSEFEVLFNGDDRDNEVEFRLLFTPLAQKNIVDLLKTKEPFGDDFYFQKRKCLNYITSDHSQGFNYATNPNEFIGFDLENMKERFIDYYDLYFKNLYFDLAPLLSIPAYQQTKTHEYIYNIPYKANITGYEQESFANKFDKDILKHKDTVTPVILKTNLERKNNKEDIVKITAHSFKTISHTEYISKLGGDGRFHNVPVVWYEYIPLEQESFMGIEDTKLSKHEFYNNSSDENYQNIVHNTRKNGIIYERGLMSYLLNNGFNNEAVDKFKSLLQRKGE